MSIQFQLRRDTNAVIETKTPAAGEAGFDTTKNEMLIGTGALLGAVRIAKKNTRDTLAPAQITANQNDYNPSGLTHAQQLLLTTDASRNVTGIVPSGTVGTVDGRELTVYNNGSFNLVLQHQNASSAAANRFDLGGADVTLNSGQALSLVYDNTATRWKIVANTAGSTPADNSISARKLATSAFGYGAGMVNGTIVESHAGNAVTFALKTLAGTDPSATDPVYFIFRDVTAANGGFFVRTVTAALSFVFSSGSSAGAVSATAFKIWLGALDNGGTVELFAVNCRSSTNSIYPLGSFPLITTTAEGGAGAATSAQVPYSTTARTSKAYIPIGFASYETGLVTAGTWVAAPTRLQLYGFGQPLPGHALQTQRNDTSAAATGSTVVPHDDTIPQNTEGDQYLSQAITPSSAANVLEVEAQLIIGSSTGSGDYITASLYQDATASAFATTTMWQGAVSSESPVNINRAMLAGLTTATTLKVRAGPRAAGTMTLNGASGSRTYGGALNSFIKVKEIMA